MSKPVVTVKQGELRGSQARSVTGGSYISFRGIPYAAPPVGDLRFADPQPPQPWTGIRDAFAEGPMCMQYDLFTEKIDGDEDCLYLNVVTTSVTGSRPVMVWIHGGAFISGDGGFGTYGPDYLMGSGIVYVGINYRLGVLGFLHLDYEVVSGNAGLKDQVAALKWVKENIAQFGGDPNNVTIFGESAGGASVHYHLLSPLSKGLFHKAISQSGVAVNSFASVSGTLDKARRFVAALGGKDVTDPVEIVQYLRSVPAEQLIKTQRSLYTLEERATFFLPFMPGVDDKSVEPFMPKQVTELAAEGFDKPVMIGYTSHEGIFFLSEVFWPKEVQAQAFQNLIENFEKTLPQDLIAKADPSKVPEIARELKEFYFGDKRITNDQVDEYVQYYGDLLLTFGIHGVVEIQRKKKSPTYFYRFSYDSPTSLNKLILKAQAKGSAHAAELDYLFYATMAAEYIEKNFGPKERLVRDRMVRMWTDFAKTGNPTPSVDDLITQRWKPVTETAKNYIDIDAELSVGANPNQDMWEAWNRAYAMADDQ